MGVCEALGMLPGTAPTLGGCLLRRDRESGWARSSHCQRLPTVFLKAFSHGSRNLLEILLIGKDAQLEFASVCFIRCWVLREVHHSLHQPRYQVLPLLRAEFPE